uniref:Oxysterol-binding protein n=1 Tax=Ciona intestinalis TaxID=7719 RepID=F6W8D0_CIOIN
KMEESEVKLLNLSRNGRHLEILELLDAHPNIDINCKGKSKSTYSWTALHLASYFGHTEAVKVLLSRGANPNIRNHTGDTALHKASLTKREEVVHCLLEHSSNPTIANDDRKTPSQVASDIAIKNVLEAAEKVHVLKETEKFLQCLLGFRISRYGSFVNMDTPDEHGNTALHHAAMRDQRTIAIVLLQHGVDPSKRNKQGERACDVTMSSQMKKILDVKPVRQNHNMVQRFEGPLMKKKRFLSPRWHWVVLERGVISYFARRADAAVGSKRRFFKYLTESTVTTREDNNHGFVVRFFDGSFHHLMVNQSNKPLINRQKWVDAIREHAEYSNHFVAADNVVDSDSESDDPIIPIIDIKNIVQTAEVHQKVLQTHVEHLTPLIQNFCFHPGQLMPTHVLGKCHEILGSATDMMKEFQMCLNVMQRQEQIRESKLLDECERNRVLQQSLQALATQHHNLELTIESQAGSASDEDEFYDAISGDSDDEDDVMNFEDVSLVEADEEPKYHAVTRGDYDPTINSDESQSKSETSSLAPVGGHRDRLACPMFSRDEFSIWHILRQCIGKELSKITMPVIFNEPLSFIQRLCEYMEYSCLLERACNAEDSVQRMEYVAAFAVSALASQLDRLGKPFNPLLGETYGYERSDLGFTWVSEQVSHHPPVSAFHATGTKHPFTFHGSVHPKLKFWGKSVEIEPRGWVTLHLKNPDETYTWTNPKCSVHNIVVGKLWIEQHGVMEITNHRTISECYIILHPCWFKNDLNKVEAKIIDISKQTVRILEGDWTKHLYSFSVDAHERFVATATQTNNGTKQKSSRKKTQNSSTSSDDIASFMTSQDDDVMCRCLWEVQERPDWSVEMYNMTRFAMSLNADESKGHAPTDSRLRPDIRALENGDIDGASGEKHRLEEKQRSARKARGKKKAEWTPRWFERRTNDATKSDDWIFNEKYLDSDWSKCPDIF